VLALLHIFERHRRALAGIEGLCREGVGKRLHRRKYIVLRCLDCIVVKRMI